MLLLSGGRPAFVSRALLRQLSALLDQEDSISVSTSNSVFERRATTASSSTSLSSHCLQAPHRRALFTSSSSSSTASSVDSSSISSSSGHPTEEAEAHACVPEGATLAEEGIIVDDSPPSSSSTPVHRNKRTTPPPPRPSPPTFDPLRTADALWPQSSSQRRVGQRVHRALQAILHQPRSATLPEAVSARLLGSGYGFALAGARASPDGKSVFVLYDCSLGMEEDTRSALRAAAGPLRSAVSRVAGFKKMPKLVFVQDGEGGCGGGRRERGGRIKERSGGTVAEIEAEMARLGLLGGGVEAQEKEEEEEEEEEKKQDEEEEGTGSRWQ